ncbi:MAG: DUF1570 domain-containing protein [Gemmataceae bacterium]
MHTLALLTTALLGQTPANLDLADGTLKGWDGSGFKIARLEKAGGGFALSSDDAANPTREGMIRYVLRMPRNVSKLVFKAQAVTPAGVLPDARLDIVLAGDDEAAVPRHVRTAAGWAPAPRLFGAVDGKALEYAWDVGDHQGRLMQIVLIDKDARPGCHLVASGFRFVKVDPFQVEDFTRYIVEIQGTAKLEPFARFDSKRFLALSNASEKFSMQTMRFCEIIYDLFFVHFQKKGFALKHPAQTLMLAVFDSPDGFEAYLKRKMPAGITGIYDQKTNRLVIYDLRTNRGLLAERDKALKRPVPSDKGRYVDAVHAHFDEIAKDFNVGTTMHEAAHQLSFNAGLLNRQGDVPAWLAEGLACYCEATDRGDWQAIGAANPGRINDLRPSVAGKRPWIPLRTLLQSEEWLAGPQALQGYAQSWALFHMLMHEETPRLRAYLKAVYPRPFPEYRVQDFAAAFGDVGAFETRYQAYMRKLVEAHPVR